MTNNVMDIVSIDDLTIGDQIAYEGLVFTVTGIAPSEGWDKEILVEESDKPLTFRKGDRVSRFIKGLDPVRDESAEVAEITDLTQLDPIDFTDPNDTRPRYYLAACTVAFRDRIIVSPQYFGAIPHEGVVTRIKITQLGKLEFTFNDGFSTTLDAKDMVAILERGAVIDASTAVGNVGEITVVLRIDGDGNIDAKHAAKLFAVYIQNKNQALSDAIMSQVLNVDSGAVPLEVLTPSK